MLALKAIHSLDDIIRGDHIAPISSIQAVFIEMGVVEKESPESIRKNDVRIDVQPPSKVLEVIERRVDGGALVERALVLKEEVGGHAHHAMFTRYHLCLFISMGSDDYHRIQVPMILSEREIEHVIKANTGCDSL